MKKARVIIVLALALAVLAGCATSSGITTLSSPSPVLDRIQKRDMLVVGTVGDMPPFNMTSKDGKIIGYEADLARYLADSLGVELEFKTMQFSELLPALEAGKVDMVMSSVTMTTKRNAKYAFVGPYYISGKGILTNLATLANTQAPGEIDKSDFKIAALEGSTSQEFVEEVLSKTTLVKAKSYDEAVDLVLKGEVTAMLADHPICVVSVLRHPDSELFTIVSPFTYEPIGVVLPAIDPLFVNLTENYLNTLEGAGALDNLRDYWFSKGDWWDKVR
jgi:polar amino acid transport system substrate-binding protein